MSAQRSGIVIVRTLIGACAWMAWAALPVSLASVAISAAQAPSATGSVVRGRIVEAGASGAQTPVRRAIVTLTGSGLPLGRSAVTDDTGAFVIDRVPDGEFVLSASRPAFLTTAYGATRPGRAGTPITVRAGQPRPDVTLAMPRGAVVEGILRDAVGDPASNMRVEAIRLLGRSATSAAAVAGTGRTDDRGIFRIYGLPAGDYVLAATPQIIVGGMGDLGSPSESDVDAQLAALRVRRDGAPVNTPGAPTAPGTPNSGAPPALPKNRGSANPATFYPGVALSSQAAVISLATGEERTGLDFGMKLSHAATVSGVISSSVGGPFPTVQTEIAGDGPKLPVFGGQMSGGPSLRTNADHTFEIANVPPGHYRLISRSFGAPGTSTQVLSSGGALPKIDTSGPVLWGEAEFDVAGDDVSGVSIVLRPVPSLRGRVTFEGGAAPTGGVKLALEPITDDRRANGITSPIPTVVNADGTFEWKAIVPGPYRLTASAGDWRLKSAVGGGAELLDAGVVVGADGAPELGVVMTKTLGSIGGALSLADGKAASGYFIVAFSTDRSTWHAGSRRVQFVRPSTSGAYDVRGLPSGDYYLAALSDLEPTDLNDAAFLDGLVAASVKLTVVDGQRTEQNLRIGG